MSGAVHRATLPEARGHATRTVLCLTLGALAVTLAQTMVVPALPEIQRTLDVGPNSTTWLVTVYLLMSAVSTPILGRLGDMYGKERLLLAALGLFALGNLIAGLSHSIPLYIGGRAVSGLGSATLPLAIGIIRDELPRERVATGIGFISATFGVGGGIGLVAAGPLVDNLGVDSIFWVAFAVAVLAAVCVWRWVPESPVRAPAVVDYLGAALMSTGLASLLIAVSRGNAWGWTSTGVLTLLGIFLALAVAWCLWERRAAAPLVDLQLMRTRPVWAVNLAAFLLGLAIWVSYTLIPQFVQAQPSSGYGFGADVTTSALYLLPSAVTILLAGIASGRLSTLYGSRLPLTIGASVSMCSYASLALLHTDPWQILVGSALLGVGMGLAFGAMANIVVDNVPQDMTGVAVSVNMIVRHIGGAVGAQVAAAILTASAGADGVAAVGGFTASFAMSAAGAAVALLVTVLLLPRGSTAAELAHDEREDARAGTPLAAAAAPEGELALAVTETRS